MTLLPHMFFAATHVYHTCFLLPHMYTAHDFPAAHVHDITSTHVEQFWLIWAVVILAIIHFCETAGNVFKNRLIQWRTCFKQKLNFLSTAQHASSSLHFCVDQFFWAIAIRAVENLKCEFVIKSTDILSTFFIWTFYSIHHSKQTFWWAGLYKKVSNLKVFRTNLPLECLENNVSNNWIT